MIMTVEELKQYIKTELETSQLEFRLSAIESMVRAYTHNTFHKRHFRLTADVINGELAIATPLIKNGDTVEISGSQYNDGLYVYPAKDLTDETGVTVFKVEYPMDIKLGVISLIKWDLERRDKTGVQSESISRYSVSYGASDGDGSTVGYPKSLIGFLEPYRKARF